MQFQKTDMKQIKMLLDQRTNVQTNDLSRSSEMGFGPEMSIEQLTKLLAEEIEYLEDNSRWALNYILTKY